MNDKEARKALELSERITAEIGRIGGPEEIAVIMVAIGIVLGAFAKASKQADAVLPIAINVAQGIIKEDLLD